MAIDVSCDLRSRFGPVRDQGTRPTCLAFAASDAHAALRGGWEPLSPEFVFYHAHRRAGSSPKNGARLTEILAALKVDGQPRESEWAYLSELPSDLDDYGPPAGVSVYRRDGEARTHTIDEAIAHLDAGKPVVILMTLSDAFYTPEKSGVVRAGPTETPDPSRRHAVVGVAHGNVDGERALLVRNSWGSAWGDNGHAWLLESFLVPRLARLALLTEEIDVPAKNIAA